MATANLVLATSIQSIPRLLGGGRGFVVDPKRMERELIRVLKNVYRNRNVIVDYGLRARSWVIKNHSLESVCLALRGVIYGS